MNDNPNQAVSMRHFVMMVVCLWGLTGCENQSPAPHASDLSQALELLGAGQLEAAEAALTDYLATHPESSVAHEELRWLYFNQFRTRDVERLVEEGIRRHPGEHEFLRHAMLTQFRPQLPQEGLAYLEQVQQQHPGQLRVLLGLGFAYWHLGELQQAREAFNAALKRAPQDFEVQVLVAEFLIEQNEYDLAAELLGIQESSAKAHDLAAKTDDRWWWLCSLIAESRDHLPLALEQVQQASRLRPFEIKYIQRQGLLLQRLGKAEAAALAFEQAHDMEANQMALNEIVLSGAVSVPTPVLCEEIAGRYEVRGQQSLAEGWRLLGQRLQAGYVPAASALPQ